MFVYQGQLFDIYAAQVINDIQYPPGWFADPDNRLAVGIEPVVNAEPPQVTSQQKAIILSFTDNNDGTWTANWAIVMMSPEELAIKAAELAAAKLIKNAEIDQMRLQVNFSSFMYLSKPVSCDQISRSDIDAVEGNISLMGTFPEGFPGFWKSADKTLIPLPTVDDFKAMYAAMTKQGTANFVKSQTLKQQLDDATTIQEVQSIAW